MSRLQGPRLPEPTPTPAPAPAAAAAPGESPDRYGQTPTAQPTGLRGPAGLPSDAPSGLLGPRLPEPAPAPVAAPPEPQPLSPVQQAMARGMREASLRAAVGRKGAAGVAAAAPRAPQPTVPQGPAVGTTAGAAFGTVGTPPTTAEAHAAQLGADPKRLGAAIHRDSESYTLGPGNTSPAPGIGGRALNFGRRVLGRAVAAVNPDVGERIYNSASAPAAPDPLKEQVVPEPVAPGTVEAINTVAPGLGTGIAAGRTSRAEEVEQRNAQVRAQRQQRLDASRRRNLTGRAIAIGYRREGETQAQAEDRYRNEQDPAVREAVQALSGAILEIDRQDAADEQQRQYESRAAQRKYQADSEWANGILDESMPPNLMERYVAEGRSYQQTVLGEEAPLSDRDAAFLSLMYSRGHDIDPDDPAARAALRRGVLEEAFVGAGRSLTDTIAGGVLQFAGEVTGTEAPKDLAAFLGDTAQDENLRRSALAEGSIFQNDSSMQLAQKLSALLGEQAPILMATLTTGGTGGMAARLAGLGLRGQTLAATTSAQLAMLAIEAGSQMRAVRADGGSDQQALLEGLSYGMLAALLEVAPVARFLSAGKANRQAAAGVVRNFLTNAGKQALAEGTTEFAQAMSSELIAMMGGRTDINAAELVAAIERAAEEGVAGGLIGGVMGSAESVAQANDPNAPDSALSGRRLERRLQQVLESGADGSATAADVASRPGTRVQEADAGDLRRQAPDTRIEETIATPDDYSTPAERAEAAKRDEINQARSEARYDPAQTPPPDGAVYDLPDATPDTPQQAGADQAPQESGPADAAVPVTDSAADVLPRPEDGVRDADVVAAPPLEDGPYAGDDPAALLAAAREELEGHQHAVKRLRDQLASGRSPSGRALTAKGRAQLEDAIRGTEGLIAGMESEITDVEGQVSRQAGEAAPQAAVRDDAALDEGFTVGKNQAAADYPLEIAAPIRRDPGKKGVVYQPVQTVSGRQITPPHHATRIDTPRKMRAYRKALDGWLMYEAFQEAERNGDTINSDRFRLIHPHRVSPADRDLANLYLFGRSRIEDPINPLPIQPDRSPFRSLVEDAPPDTPRADPADAETQDPQPAVPRRTVDARLPDPDAASADPMGLVPAPKTLPDGDPLLTPPMNEDGSLNKQEAVVVEGSSTHKVLGMAPGTYTRDELHAKLLDHFYTKSVALDRPTIFFTGGGGGAGKSTFVKRYKAEGRIPENILELNADEFKVLLPEWDAFKQAGDGRAAAVLHEESSVLAKRLQARLIEDKRSFIFDATLANPKKTLALVDKVKAAGFHTNLIAVTVDPYEAAVRASQRGVKSNRHVPPGLLLDAHKGFNAGLPRYVKAFDEVRVFENTRSDEYVTLAVKGHQQALKVLNEPLFSAIIKRKGLRSDAPTREQLFESYPNIVPTDEDVQREHAQRQQEQQQADPGGAQAPARREADEGQRPQADGGVLLQPARGDRGAEEGGSPGPAADADDVQRPGRDVATPAPSTGAQDTDDGTQPGHSDQLPDRRDDGDADADAGQGRRSDDRPAPRARDDAQVDEGGEPGRRGGSTLPADRPGGDEVADPDGPAEADALRGDAEDGDGPRGARRRTADVAPVVRPPADSDRRNFQIKPDTTLAPSGVQGRFRANIAALKLLHVLERERREATADEKATLAAYTGWGWANFQNEKGQAMLAALQEVATKEEIAAIKRSTLNAHYTTPAVIGAMWSMVERLGFKGGKVLEPAAGIGHFIGTMPGRLADRSRSVMVELDGLTGRIAHKLYPESEVYAGTGFQDAPIKNNSIDLAISNVPFGPYKIVGRDYKDMLIHDYFFARALDKVKPGGLVAFITSDGTMQKLDAKMRRRLAGAADLVGAVRLPNTAFKGNAGTEVTTDILIFRKHTEKPFKGRQAFERVLPHGTSTYTDQGKDVVGELFVNEYFIEHPEMVLGEHTLAGTMYSRGDYALLPRKGQDLAADLAGAVKRLPKNVFDPQEVGDGELKGTEADPGDKELGYVWRDGQPYQVIDGKLTEPDWLSTKGFGTNADIGISAEDRAKRLVIAEQWIALKGVAAHLFAAENRIGVTDEDLRVPRARLNSAYDAYVKKYGKLTREDGKGHYEKARFLMDDPDYAFMQALEVETKTYDKKQKRTVVSFEKGDIFKRRIRTPRVKPDRVGSVEEAIAVSMGFYNGIDIGEVARLMGTDQDAAHKAVLDSGRVFENPVTGLFETSELYLSGNVRKKLRLAREAAATEKAYRRNVEALEAVQPETVPLTQVHFNLSSRWLPDDVLGKWASEIFGTDVSIQYNPPANAYAVQAADKHTDAITADYGNDDRTGLQLLVHALNGSTPTVYRKTTGSDGKPKQVKDAKATEVQQQAIQRLNREFDAWAKNSTDTVRLDGEDVLVLDRLESAYNDANNGMVAPSYDGSYLQLPGLTDVVYRSDHRLSVVARILQEGSAVMAHGVGSGKTFSLIVAAQESRRLGLRKKPLIVVKNPTITDFAKSYRAAYPDARVLVATDKSMNAKNRARFISHAALGDWDAVIVTHTQFTQIPVKPETMLQYFANQVAELESAIIEQKAAEKGRDGRGKDPSTKQLEAAKARLEAKMQAAAERLEKQQDGGVYWDDIGVDMLQIDEAHDFKNIPLITRKGNIKGVPNQESMRAMDLMMKVAGVQAKNGGRGVVLATGTPITNTMAEAYVMLKLATPYLLAEYNISNFDEFANTFGEVVAEIEYTWGGSFKRVERFNRFVNLPELVTMIRSGFDVKIGNKELGLKVPERAGGGTELVVVEQTPAMQVTSDFIQAVADAYEQAEPSERRENSWVPIVTMQVGMAAATDPRLLDPDLPDDPGSKVNQAVENIVDIWKTNKRNRGTQLVFADRFSPMDISRLESFAGVSLGGVEVEREAVDLDDLDLDDTPAEAAQVADEDATRMKDKRFNLYRDIKDKLIAAGVPAAEIAIVHDYGTDNRKKKLYERVNSGEIRILMGSTEKMGVGVNVQERLSALHHLDPPRRMTPAMQDQRDGRIIRQGHLKSHPSYKEVRIIAYGVEASMDTGIYQKMEQKSAMTDQALKGRAAGRTSDDMAGELTSSMAEIKAKLTGDPRVLRLIELKDIVQGLDRELEIWQGDHNRRTRQLQAFRYEAANVGDHADGLEALRPRVAETFDAYAADLNAAESAMREAREAAREGTASADWTDTHESLRKVMQQWAVPGHVHREEHASKSDPKKTVKAYVWRRPGAKPQAIGTNLKDASLVLKDYGRQHLPPMPEPAGDYRALVGSKGPVTRSQAEQELDRQLEQLGSQSLDAASGAASQEITLGDFRIVLSARRASESGFEDIVRERGAAFSVRVNDPESQTDLLNSPFKGGGDELLSILGGIGESVDWRIEQDRKRVTELRERSIPNLAKSLQEGWPRQSERTVAGVEMRQIEDALTGENADTADLPEHQRRMLAAVLEQKQAQEFEPNKPAGGRRAPVPDAVAVMAGRTPSEFTGRRVTEGTRPPASSEPVTIQFPESVRNYISSGSYPQLADVPQTFKRGDDKTRGAVMDQLAEALRDRGFDVSRNDSKSTASKYLLVTVPHSNGVGKATVAEVRYSDHQAYGRTMRKRGDDAIKLHFRGSETIASLNERFAGIVGLISELEPVVRAAHENASSIREVRKGDSQSELPRGAVLEPRKGEANEQGTGDASSGQEFSSPDLHHSRAPRKPGRRSVGPVPAAGQAPAEPATRAGRRLVRAIENDPEGKKVGTRSIFEFVADRFKVEIRERLEQLTEKMPASYLAGDYHMIRTRAGSMQVNFHEAGHALSALLTDADPDWLSTTGGALIRLTQLPGSWASADTVEEGFAELVRLWVTDPGSIDIELRKRFRSYMEANGRTEIEVLDDARLAFVAHEQRSVNAKFASYQNDKPKREAWPATVERGWHWLLYTLSAGSALHTRVHKRTFRAIKRHGLKMAQDAHDALKDTPADYTSAHQMTLHVEQETDRAVFGADSGPEGLRIIQFGGGNPFHDLLAGLPDEQLTEFVDLFNIPDQGAGDGNYLRLHDKTMHDVRELVGEGQWEAFEVYGWQKASLARWQRSKLVYPGLTEGITPEKLMQEIAAADAAHPEWAKGFTMIRDIMNQSLLVPLLSGELTAEDALKIGRAYEDYWPLPRSVYGNAPSGKSNPAEPSAGIHRAYGSHIPFVSIDDAVRARVHQAMQAYYQNQVILSIHRAAEQIANNKRIPLEARAVARRIITPLELDWKLVATLEEHEQQKVIAAYMDEQTAQELQMPAAALPKEARTDPEDVYISFPGQDVWRRVRPNAVRVIAPWVGGERQYFQVDDPILYEFLARTNQGSKALMKMADTLAGATAPWKRAITHTWPFVFASVLSRDPMTAMMLGEGRLAKVPYGFILRAAVNRLLLGLKKGGDLSPISQSELLSKALDQTERKAHRGVVDHFMDVLKEGIFVPGWSEMSAVRRLQKLPGQVAATIHKPGDVMHLVTGSRAAAQFAESLSREGAYLEAKRSGYSDRYAQAQYDFVTGNFGERSGFPTFAAMFRAAGFLNPALQIIMQTYQRAGSTDPRVRSRLGVSMALLTVTGGLAAAINYLMLDDDDKEELRRRTPEDRLRYMQIGVPWVRGVRLRLPFDYGPSGAAAGVGYNMIEGHLLGLETGGREEALQVIGRTMSLPGFSDFLGPYFGTMLDVSTNHSSFFDESIVPAYIEASYPNTPEMQAYWGTPTLYRWLGARLNMSPIKIEYAVRNMLTSQVADTVRLGDQVFGDREIRQPADAPFVGRLFARDLSPMGAHQVQQLSELDEDYRAAMARRNEAERSIDIDIAQALQRIRMRKPDADYRQYRDTDPALPGVGSNARAVTYLEQQLRAADPDAYQRIDGFNQQIGELQAMHQTMSEVGALWDQYKRARERDPGADFMPTSPLVAPLAGLTNQEAMDALDQRIVDIARGVVERAVQEDEAGDQ